MSSKLFGSLVAGALLATLSSPAVAKEHKAGGKKGGQCTHACKGHGACGGHGNDNGCAGKNACAGKGQVPEACAAAKSEKDCKAVKGDDDKAMCKWKA